MTKTLQISAKLHKNKARILAKHTKLLRTAKNFNILHNVGKKVLINRPKYTIIIFKYNLYQSFDSGTEHIPKKPHEPDPSMDETLADPRMGEAFILPIEPDRGY